MTPTLSVIILTWNGKGFLPECLDALAAQSYRDFETVLLDNGSTDGSADYVREHYPWVRLVELPENAGFAGGNNRALAECRGRYIVTLNNDTKAEPDFLAELVRRVEVDPGIGMVAAKMLNFYHKERIDSVGVRIAANGMGQNIGCQELDLGQYDRNREAFGPCAGAALYRRAMLDEVGFFDDGFFAYYEDLDLAWRGRLAGWRCLTAPEAVVLHVHSATSGKMSPFTVFQVQRNKWFVLLKNWPAGLLAARLPLIVTFDLAALLLAVLRGRGLAACRARIAVLLSLRALLRQRRAVQRLRKLSNAEVKRLFSGGEGAYRTFKRKMRDR
jgi:GT2 family glycosyltransferase